MRYAFRLGQHTHKLTRQERAEGPLYKIEESEYEPAVEAKGNGSYRVVVDDQVFEFSLKDGVLYEGASPLDLEISRAKPELIRAGGKGRKGDGRIKPPMPGKIVEVPVKEGDEVQEGQVVIILEAMKMQNDIKAPFGGIVQKVHVQEGSNVEATTVMVDIAPHAEPEA
ncbi:MAG: biotin/lipoyl-containing protein [Thermoplasmatota archaeon]